MATRTYDYVIVGAGSAGCVLANRLSADPACRVVLLEAGGSDRRREIQIPAAFTKLLATEYDWNYRTSRQPQLADRELYWPRGKTLGGSSSINGQIWTRGHRADYDGWAETCPGWSYEEVLPYFRRAERRVGSNTGGVYGTTGPQFISELRDPNPTTLAFLAGCAELGLRRLVELNEPDTTGYAPSPVTQRRGLRSHLHCPKPVTLFAADSPAQFARFLLARRGMLTSSINEAVAFIRSDPALDAPDVELVWLPVPVLGEGLTPPPSHGLTLAVELLQPDSHGHIRLAGADPAEPPVIDPGCLTAESDLRGLVAGLRIAERLCDTAALRPYVGAPMAPWPGKVDDTTLATYVREHAQTAFHPVGTCRMGNDDAAVVDCELRVRGLDGLRVVDASVMPRIIRGHTHAPTVMIAERASDLIRASNHELEPGRATTA